MEFKYAVILGSFAFVVFLMIKEIRRADKARLLWRILASIVSVACLVLMLLPINYQVKNKDTFGEMTLLTEGASFDSVASKKGSSYTLDSTVFRQIKNPKVKNIPDLLYFLRTHTDIKKLNIYGYGLNYDQLKGLSNYEISFHPANSPTGIISCSWQDNLKPTDPLVIQGIYNNPAAKPVKLLLYGLGSVLDSVIVPEKSTSKFSLKSRPKQSGKAIYSLIALQGNDTLAREPVPVQVVNQSPMKVMILASFPDFEYKFLKNWLYENQYPLAFRSQISKNKYSTDFLNMESMNLNSINSTILKKIDLLIIDEEEFDAISASERSVIAKEVENGMGLFVRISSPKSGSALLKGFNRFESPSLKDNLLTLRSNGPDIKFGQLPLEQSLFFKAIPGDQPLVTDENGKVLVNSHINGTGKILVSSISATYHWQLSGNQTDYTTFWSFLLAKAARKEQLLQTWQLIPLFPVPQQKLRIIIEQPASNNPPDIGVNNIRLSPRQNMEVPFQWDAITWPEKTGWNTISVNQTVEAFYVYDKYDWGSIKNNLKINATAEFINTNNRNVKALKKDDVSYQQISQWWFFIGFLVAAGFLWYESRVLESK